MSKKPAPCIASEDDLLATAIGEASEDARRRVERHVGVCGPCRREFHGYQDLDRSVIALSTGIRLAAHSMRRFPSGASPMSAMS